MTKESVEEEYPGLEEYNQAGVQRTNALCDLAMALKYTIKTGDPKPPRLNNDGSEHYGVSPLAEEIEAERLAKESKDS